MPPRAPAYRLEFERPYPKRRYRSSPRLTIRRDEAIFEYSRRHFSRPLALEEVSTSENIANHESANTKVRDMKACVAPFVFAIVLLAGCSSLDFSSDEPTAIIRVNCLQLELSPETAKKWGLGGLLAEKREHTPLTNPIPSILTPSQSKILVSELKRQTGAKVASSFSVTVPSGQTTICRNVFETPQPTPQGESEKTPQTSSKRDNSSEPAIIDVGSRFEVETRYDSKRDVILESILCVENGKYLVIDNTSDNSNQSHIYFVGAKIITP